MTSHRFVVKYSPPDGKAETAVISAATADDAAIAFIRSARPVNEDPAYARWLYETNREMFETRGQAHDGDA